MAFDLQVFNQQTSYVVTETIAQAVEKFNEASGSTIVLKTKPTKGDFAMEASFKEIANMVRYRDAYSDDAIASQRLQQLLDISVKVAAGTYTIEWTPAQYNWTLQNPASAALVIGEQLGKARIAHMLNTGLLAASAAISGNAGMVHGDGTEKISFRGLNSGSAKMGDRSASLKAWVMHSTSSHDLYDNALANVETLFQYDTVNIVKDPFGRIIVVTDSPSLVDASGANPIYKVLGLVQDAILVDDNDDFNSVIVPVVGFQNIGAKYQSEWSYNTGVNGYAWDDKKGGKSPNSTALGTPTNWNKTATSNKNTAGVLVQTK